MMRFGGTLAAKNDLPGIQILRGIAALAVIIHHSLEESNGALHRFSPDWLTTSGAAVVDIFFVISGFIMLHVSFRTGRASLRPGQFLLRRITRIYPLYWLTCLGAVTIAAFGLLSRSFHLA
jgi:peptidoglycan/LPS O-acetylase OafA/YrhL